MIVAQQVVRLQSVRRNQLDAFQIPARQFQIAILRNFHQKYGPGVSIKQRQRLAKRLGLVRIQLPGIHDDQLLVRKLRGKRRAQRAQHHLAGNRYA